MSSTLAPDVLSPNNPISSHDVVDTLHKLGVSQKRDVEDYTSLLTGIWELWNKVDQMPDYVPHVDEERFPRKDVHYPSQEQNPANAWAWRASVKDSTNGSKGGLLDGKTVCLKVGSVRADLCGS